MPTLLPAAVLKYNSTFVCAIAKYSIDVNLSKQYGIHCLDKVTELKKISAYLWLANSSCDLSNQLICNLESLYTQLITDAYSCLQAANSCDDSSLYDCTNINIADITGNTTPCIIPIGGITIII